MVRASSSVGIGGLHTASRIPGLFTILPLPQNPRSPSFRPVHANLVKSPVLTGKLLSVFGYFLLPDGQLLPMLPRSRPSFPRSIHSARHYRNTDNSLKIWIKTHHLSCCAMTDTAVNRKIERSSYVFPVFPYQRSIL